MELVHRISLLAQAVKQPARRKPCFEHVQSPKERMTFVRKRTTTIISPAHETFTCLLGSSSLSNLIRYLTTGSAFWRDQSRLSGDRPMIFIARAGPSPFITACGPTHSILAFFPREDHLNSSAVLASGFFHSTVHRRSRQGSLRM